MPTPQPSLDREIRDAISHISVAQWRNYLEIFQTALDLVPEELRGDYFPGKSTKVFEYYNTSKELSALNTMNYEIGLIVSHPWSDWLNGSNLEDIPISTYFDAVKVLCATSRMDHYMEGTLGDAMCNGVMRKIFETFSREFSFVDFLPGEMPVLPSDEIDLDEIKRKALAEMPEDQKQFAEALWQAALDII